MTYTKCNGNLFLQQKPVLCFGTDMYCWDLLLYFFSALYGVFKGVKMTASALPERVVSLLRELVPALLYFRPERLGRDVARLGGVLPVKHLVTKRPGWLGLLHGLQPLVGLLLKTERKRNVITLKIVWILKYSYTRLLFHWLSQFTKKWIRHTREFRKYTVTSQ